MYQVLLVFQLLVAAGLIGLVLLQQGRGADAGAAFGSGSAGSIFGSRGPASFLAKLTALLALLFFMNSIGLAYYTTRTVDRGSVVERFQEQSPNDLPAGDEAGTADIPAGVAGESEPGESGAPSDVPARPDSSGEPGGN